MGSGPTPMPGEFAGLSAAELSALVEERAKSYGAHTVSVTLNEAGDHLDPISPELASLKRLFAYPPHESEVGQNQLRKFKALEQLWNRTLAIHGAGFYTHVLALREDIYW